MLFSQSREVKFFNDAVEKKNTPQDNQKSFSANSEQT